MSDLDRGMAKTAKTKIGFVLLSNRKNAAPSTRISVLNMLPFLCDAGYEPHILFEPPQATEEPDVSVVLDSAVRLGIDIVYFQKVRGHNVVETVKQLSARGIKTVYGVCDFIEDEIAAATDATVVVTEYLRSLYDARLRGKIFVVHDAIEHPDLRVNGYRNDVGSADNPLRAVLVTAVELSRIPVIQRPPAYVRVNIVGNYRDYSLAYTLKRNYWKFMEAANWVEKGRILQDFVRRDFDKTNWDINGVYTIMAASDIGIIAVDTRPDPMPHKAVSSWQVRSENRLTLKMALGLPVIASPVPSYKDVIVQGENGFLAATREEWLACFGALRDPERRAAIGRRARESVIQRYSKQEQARKLLAVLRQLCSIA